MRSKQNSLILCLLFSSLLIKAGLAIEYEECSQSDIQFDQCQNKGVCLKYLQAGTNTTQFVCKCQPGYSGPICAQTYCLNDAKFYLDSKQNMRCECNARFTGDQCQFDKCIHKKAKCSPHCLMNSKCECLCGESCDFHHCSQKNGTCYNNGGELACKCRAGFSSPICSIDECKGYCFNGGACVRLTNSISCNCPEGYRSDKRCGIKDYKKIMSQKHEQTPVPSEYRSTRIIMYALSITLFACLFSIGGYVAIQRGLFQFLLTTFNFNTKYGQPAQQSSSYNRTQFPYVKTNLSFNKLEEDEQSIAANNFGDLS